MPGPPGEAGVGAEHPHGRDRQVRAEHFFVGDTPAGAPAPRSAHPRRVAARPARQDRQDGPAAGRRDSTAIRENSPQEGLAGERGVERAVGFLIAAGREPRQAQRAHRDTRVQCGEAARAERDRRAGARAGRGGRWTGNERAFAVAHGERVQPGAGRPCGVSKPQHGADVRPGREAAAGDRGEGVEHPQHPGPLHVQGHVGLGGQPRDRILRADGGVNRLGHRGVRRHDPPERAGGPRRSRPGARAR